MKKRCILLLKIYVNFSIFFDFLECIVDKEKQLLMLKKSRNELLANPKMRDGFNL